MRKSDLLERYPDEMAALEAAKSEEPQEVGQYLISNRVAGYGSVGKDKVGFYGITEEIYRHTINPDSVPNLKELGKALEALWQADAESEFTVFGGSAEVDFGKVAELINGEYAIEFNAKPRPRTVSSSQRATLKAKNRALQEANEKLNATIAALAEQLGISVEDALAQVNAATGS